MISGQSCEMLLASSVRNEFIFACVLALACSMAIGAFLGAHYMKGGVEDLCESGDIFRLSDDSHAKCVRVKVQVTEIPQ